MDALSEIYKHASDMYDAGVADIKRFAESHDMPLQDAARLASIALANAITRGDIC